MKRFSESCERNTPYILEVLKRHLPDTGLVLEVGCGTGQHAVAFAAAFNALEYQPTDVPGGLESVEAWRAEANLGNLRQALEFDLFDAPPVDHADAVICINTIHIAPDEATPRLFQHVANLLPTGAPFFLYGPFRYKTRELEPSNEAFDISLKSRGFSGLKTFEDLVALGQNVGLRLDEDVAMPSNNHTLVWRRV
jgi:SAM-dependent methyltransferase